MASRLFVQNLPKKISEAKLREHFSKFGTISDLKIVTREQTNRRFCFLGFKSEEVAKKTKDYFDKTYVMTSKISIEFAKLKDDPDLPNAWSRHSKGNVDKIANEAQNAETIEIEKKPKTKSKGLNNEDAMEGIDESKKRKFKELLDLMKPKKGHSWNDNVENDEEAIAKKKIKDSLLEELEKKTSKLGIPKVVEVEIKKEGGDIGKRLYVLNLAYDSTEDDVRAIFEKYGTITELKLPLDANKKFRGFAYISFSQENEAMHCFAELDNAIVQGRILHLKPAEEKPEKKLPWIADPTWAERSSFKTFSKEKRMQKLTDTTNWNTLFMNPNSIVNEMCSRFEIKKADLFSVEQENLASKIALAESKLIAETIDWMKREGMDLSFLDSPRADAERSKRVLLVKNLHTRASPSDLSELFGRFGKVEKALVAPNGVIGIVVMEGEAYAKNAFDNLSYFQYKHEPLYLEYAPIGMIEEPNEVENPIEIEDPKAEDFNESKGKILFIKNLNFTSIEDTLTTLFSKYGEIIKVKIPRDREGKSKGFGFVEFREKESVNEALKKSQGAILDSHCLQLSVSTPKPEEKSTRKVKEINVPSSKLLIKNLAFEATRSELSELFKQFGELKSIRIPKKLDNTHRLNLFLK